MFAVVTFLLFTGFVGLMSWLLTRRDDHVSSTGYFLGGRSLTWIVIAGSLLLTNLSTEQLVGLNGGGYSHGMQVAAWEIFASVAMIVMAGVFLPRYLKGGVTTVSQYLKSRYDSTVGIIISVLLLLSLLTNLLPFVLYSGALFMEKVFRVSEAFGIDEAAALWLTTIALGVVGSIYAIFGGLKAVAVSDTLNGVGLLIGGLVIPLLGIQALGHGNIAEGVLQLTQHNPQLLNPIGKAGENIPFSTVFSGMILLHVYYWCTNQAIVQRTFGAKSLAQGQKGLLFAAAIKLLGPVYLVLPGIIAFHLFAGSLDTSDNAYGALVQKVLPPGMLGFFAAVIFGAILSSFNSGLNSATTLFSVDLYKGVFRKDASEANMVRVGKIFGTLVAIGAIATAPLIADFEGGLFDLMKRLSALYNVPLLTITLVGIFCPRMPAMAAKFALVIGPVFYGVFGLWQNNTIFGNQIHWLHLAGINIGLLTVVMLVVGTIWPRLEPYKQVYTAEVDITPWRGLWPSAITILFLIVVIYASLSRFG